MYLEAALTFGTRWIGRRVLPKSFPQTSGVSMSLLELTQLLLEPVMKQSPARYLGVRDFSAVHPSLVGRPLDILVGHL